MPRVGYKPRISIRAAENSTHFTLRPLWWASFLSEKPIAWRKLQTWWHKCSYRQSLTIFLWADSMFVRIKHRNRLPSCNLQWRIHLSCCPIFIDGSHYSKVERYKFFPQVFVLLQIPAKVVIRTPLKQINSMLHIVKKFSPKRPFLSEYQVLS